jgi:hypothetical protein
MHFFIFEIEVNNKKIYTKKKKKGSCVLYDQGGHDQLDWS